MAVNKTSEEYFAIGEKLKAAEFKGMVITKLKYIENSISRLGEVDKNHNFRIGELEKFQANVVGKFAVIGSIVILIANWIWDIGNNAIKSLKGH